MTIDKKYLSFSLKLPLSKIKYLKDLSTIYNKHAKVALYAENYLCYVI